MEDNKQLMSFAPTMHWTPSSYIALQSVRFLLRAFVLGEHGVVLEFDDVEVLDRFSCNRRLRLRHSNSRDFKIRYGELLLRLLWP